MSYPNQSNLSGLMVAKSAYAETCDAPIRAQSVVDNLGYRIAKAEEELARLKEAKAALENNPEIERVLTLLGRI